MKCEPGDKRGYLALSSLAVLLVVYMLSSILAADFYAVPLSAAFLIASAYSVIISKGTFSERMDCFTQGAGHPKVLLMVWIFILAGVFAGTARDMGAVEAAVNVAMRFVSPRMMFVGFFLTACFVSISIGTSVGTIVALVPVASDMAELCGISVPFVAAVVVGGALFGDNLSFISDTTIAATKAVDCRMKDKFLMNVKIVVPAVLIVAFIYFLKGRGISAEISHTEVSLIKVLPYVTVFALTLCGINVIVTLTIGILLTSIIGLCYGDFTWIGLLASAGSEIAGVSELIIVTVMAGGMMNLICYNGGLEAILNSLSKRVKGAKGAQFSIAALVCVANLCTANNTIAIISVGDMSKMIAEKYGIDRRKVASILDTFSCFVQGLIPYGAQVLMASTLAGCQPVELMPYLYYPMLLGVCSMMAIAFDWPRIKVPERTVPES